jgi:hypothetical protein
MVVDLKQKLQKISSGATFYDLPSTLKQNATCFGIGDKTSSYIMNPKTPGPVHYDVRRMYESYENIHKIQQMNKDKKCTFGLAHKYFNNNVLVVGDASP